MQSPTSSLSPSRLYALLLKMRPLEDGHTLMPFSGDLVHAAFLSWVREAAPDVAAWLHEGNKRRLFTCSSLQFPLPAQRMREAERGNIHLALRSEKIYSVRITLLLGDLFPLLYEALKNSDPRMSASHQKPFMQLGKQALLLQEAVTDDASGWCGFTSLSTMIESIKALDLGKLYPLTLEFASLTAFNRINLQNRTFGNYYGMLPLPIYIFPMLANRWRECVPPEYANLVHREHIEQYIRDDGIVIYDHHLQTHTISFTNHPQRGFVGTCTYHLRGPDEMVPNASTLSVRQQILLLARFAFYAGIGYKTAQGMGQARVLTTGGADV